MTRRLLALTAALAALPASAAVAGPRVASLDQCADQYVLALSRPQDIAALSYRADDADSRLRALVPRGAPLRRADLESLAVARFDVLVRYWGGSPAVLRRLKTSGVRVVTIDDATDFAGVRANVRKVARALDNGPGGERLIARTDAQLARSAGAWRGARALYLTPGGFTAGQGTLVGALIQAAGLTLAADAPGYGPVSLERLVLAPPAALVLGFFDKASMQGQWWSAGRTAPARRLARGRTLASLPGSILGCPAWFAAEGTETLSRSPPAGGSTGEAGEGGLLPLRTPPSSGRLGRPATSPSGGRS